MRSNAQLLFTLVSPLSAHLSWADCLSVGLNDLESSCDMVDFRKPLEYNRSQEGSGATFLFTSACAEEVRTHWLLPFTDYFYRRQVASYFQQADSPKQNRLRRDSSSSLVQQWGTMQTHARPETGLGTPAQQKIKFKNSQGCDCLPVSYADNQDIMLSA